MNMTSRANGERTVTMTSRRLADRYVLGHEVGVGGMARVHVALDERLGRRVAVKLQDAAVVATADPAGRERFLREGRTTAGFNHRHAVTVFDAGEDAGDLYIVMEFVDGPSLAEHLARNGPLPVDEVVRICRQVLSALCAAHADGIVHRDVKPANILIGADGETKLADFGIAKRFDDLGASVTSAGLVIGTPRYLAPEQALGRAATPATDVYAMGVVMFEMLTDRLPFDTRQPVATAAAEQSTAVRLRSLRSDTPGALTDLVASALEAQPDERPTAAAMLVALDALSPSPGSTMTAEPTLVMPPAVGSMLDAPPTTEAVRSHPANARRPAHEGSSGRTAAVIVFATLLLLLGGVVAAATLGARDGADSADEPAAPTLPSSVPTEPAPLATAPSVIAAPLPQPTPIEEQPIEVVVPEATVATLVPGFPVTNDLEVFLFQIERDPDRLGQSGPELADELRKVLEQQGAEQRATAEKLREVLAKWVADGEIPAAVADPLDELLAPLAN